MQVNFTAVQEEKPGPKWRKRYEELWPLYRGWYLSRGVDKRPNLKLCEKKLMEYMPELYPTYEILCNLAGGGDIQSRFLSLYCPPAYISGCSQVAWTNGKVPMLARNYDYAPDLCDGLILNSRWNDRKVIAMTDCLWGVLDGINDAGLAISLTFGGRQCIGDGFGIPLILRYILEFCENTHEAVEVLKRVPTNMAYNVTIVDKYSVFRTVYVAPDRSPTMLRIPYATNHQGRIEWKRHAQATATVERQAYLKFRLADKAMTAKKLIDSFAKSPLYTDAYASGFGTVYTSVYRPTLGQAEYRWANKIWKLSFNNFVEGSRLIRFTK
jgi:predicted choloylglycine hydrolase